MDALHVSVLLHECIDNLNIRPDGIYVDGTLGMGGHSEQIAARLTTGKLIGIDRDETAIERAGARLAPFGDRVQLVHGNFRDAAAILDRLGIDAVDGMLFDLGVSSAAARRVGARLFLHARRAARYAHGRDRGAERMERCQRVAGG